MSVPYCSRSYVKQPDLVDEVFERCIGERRSATQFALYLRRNVRGDKVECVITGTSVWSGTNTDAYITRMRWVTNFAIGK